MPNQLTITDRKLSYRFYPHFHPYVAELVKRLIAGSVRGLQAADTEYEERNADGTLKPLPNSVLVELVADTTAAIPGGTQTALKRGSQLIVFDGTVVLFPNGLSQATATLPGDLILTDPRGMRVTTTTGKADLDFGHQVRLGAATPVLLSDGTQAILPINTTLTLIGCSPKPKLYQDIFSTSYHPSELVQRPYPAKEIDFTASGAYAVYNWELFYHAPFSIAVHLSKNQRFEEAQRWFHYIFDPTDDSDGPTPERFWKVKPFQNTDVKLIEEILVNLSSGADPVLQQDTINSVGAWKNTPFRPHAVARYRPSAYMFKTVMAYLDNLIAWGDSLFRQDTGESLNEATMLYVLASNILGPRPQVVPKKSSVQPQTYADLRANLDALGNVQSEVEADLIFDLAPHPNDAADSPSYGTLRSLGTALYFCIPRNDNLLAYWDTVADRLFKIRNSLNFQGIFRQLPLFEPPIDPALLAQAAAAGLDVGAIVSGANQPLSLVRFQVLVQKAAEICQEVKTLGNNLLSAIEKEDNEALAILRARHESVILGLAETVRYAQWQEAIKTREGLEKSLDNAAQRYVYYERQLGKQESEIQIPKLEKLDTNGLQSMQFKQGEPEVKRRELEVDIFPGLEGNPAARKLSSYEVNEMILLEIADQFQLLAGINESISASLGIIPQFAARVTPLGLGAGVDFGGVQLSHIVSAFAGIARTTAGEITHRANTTAKMGSYARREQERAYQSNLAAGEITQTFKQLRAAQIREALAEREYENHKQQIKHAEEMELFLKGETLSINGEQHKKTSTMALYTWMKREVKGLYAQCFQFAFDIAKKAERALQHELGNTQLSFIQYGYLAGKEGLLAGEKLYFDIKRMEMSYHELNQREYELAKHISLLQVNPNGLLQLRATGRCTVFLPEELFDMDGPGHYFRRIKSVAVSIPCVVGPYTNVNCTLTLLKSSIRKNSLVGDGDYARTSAEDNRFSDHFGSMQSIVTSTGQNDSGLFETNLHDERYLPFEGAGAISQWQLELPGDVRQFDYNSISDVILHLRYTSREGGGLAQSAVANLKTLIDTAEAVGSVRLFSIRHEFSTEWARFKRLSQGEGDLTINLKPEHYPFWSKGRLGTMKSIAVVAKTSRGGTVTYQSGEVSSGAIPLSARSSFGGLCVGTLTNPLLPITGEFTLHFTDNTMENLWLAVQWGH
ncbi:MAG: insecticidal toxin protein [Blastocatellia bacterium]